MGQSNEAVKDRKISRIARIRKRDGSVVAFNHKCPDFGSHLLLSLNAT
ncbi:MAG: hypothetical protein Q7R57_05720 [Dehalococcoidales bacterium]|nr:hypothetical protein [Dehalococcoidales bacterium]